MKFLTRSLLILLLLYGLVFALGDVYLAQDADSSRPPSSSSSDRLVAGSNSRSART